MQIDKSQHLINGKLSLMDKLSSGRQISLNLDCNISFSIICSSLSFPVARKNLHFLTLTNFSITSKNILAGILFFYPEPPIPKRIFSWFLLT